MTLVLTRSQIQDLLDVDASLEAVRASLADPATASSTPDAIDVPGTDGLLVPMAGISGGVIANKLLVDRPSATREGLPSQTSTIVLTDARTGRAEAVLHGQLPTRARTAATTAWATHLLGRPDADRLGLVGAGAIAVETALAVVRLRPVRTVHVWSRSQAGIERFLDQVQGRMPSGVQIVPEPDPESVLATAQMVVSATPSTEPVIRGSWLRPGLHLSVVGARPRPDDREVDSAAMQRADVLVVDHRGTVRQDSGDHVMAEREMGRPLRISADLAEVLRGQHPGRTDADQVTVYNGVGCGAQDAAVCAALVRRARASGVGLEVDLSE